MGYNLIQPLEISHVSSPNTCTMFISVGQMIFRVLSISGS
jgi:hypothetical protein